MNPLIAPLIAPPTSDKALAKLAHVSPKTIRAWRHAGAPLGQALAAWVNWLAASGKSGPAACAERLRQFQALSTPATPMAELDDSEPMDDVSEAVWKARRARAQARREELALNEALGKVVPTTRVQALLAQLGKATADQLALGIWPGLLPALAGATSDTRQAVRLAHDQSILDLRGRLSRHAADCIRTLSK